MVTRRGTAALAVGAAVCFTGVPLAAGTADAAAAPKCSSTPWTSDPVVISRADQWSYAYRLTWCVEGSEIIWVEPSVTHEEVPDTCTWVGSMEEWVRPGPGGSWTAFNLSEFSCQVTTATVSKGVNPWVILNVFPDGSYAVVEKGIAE
jgi:hypothetical protein